MGLEIAKMIRMGVSWLLGYDMTTARKGQSPIPLCQPRVWKVAILVMHIEAVLGVAFCSGGTCPKSVKGLWARNPIGFLKL